jgi:hypothetical protein
MSAIAAPSNADEALGMLESALGFLAATASADMPAEAVAECLRALERAAPGNQPAVAAHPDSQTPRPGGTGQRRPRHLARLRLARSCSA